MKAVIFTEHGGPEQLRYTDVPPPVPLATDVLVRVKACALNHLDIWIRQGIPSYTVPFPHISGSDIAGVIEDVGQDVHHTPVGQAVFLSPGVSCWRCPWCLSGRDNVCRSYRLLGAQVNGGYAEYVTAPAMNAIPIPAGVTFEEAAAFPLVTVTAWHMLFALAKLKPGESVLVVGAGSGVGSMAIQLARAAGARVISTVGHSEKVRKARALGAEEVLLHSEPDLGHRIRSWTDGQGVNVAIEHVGPAVWDHCLRALKPGGRLVTCGATTGPHVQLDLRLLFSCQLSVHGSYMGTRAELVEAAALWAQGRVKPVLDQVFPLHEARAAQEKMLERQVFGKLVLTVA